MLVRFHEYGTLIFIELLVDPLKSTALCEVWNLIGLADLI